MELSLSLSLSLGDENCKRWCKFVALLYKITPFVVIKWKTVVVCNFKNQFTILKYHLIILIFCYKPTD